jgi:hypothetical protein
MRTDLAQIERQWSASGKGRVHFPGCGTRAWHGGKCCPHHFTQTADFDFAARFERIGCFDDFGIISR